MLDFIQKYPFILAFILGLIPALIWLWFWLKEDIHPEPAKMIKAAPKVGNNAHQPGNDESLLINMKYKVAKSIKWKTPGIFAGNETPKYTSYQLSVFAKEFGQNIPFVILDSAIKNRLKMR